MSYCRWSSDDFASDVYVYANVSGMWTTHVAGSRLVGEVPKVPPLGKESMAEWQVAYDRQNKWMKTATHAPIGLPHDGESFDDDGPGECADRLESLKALGYNVPQYAIDALREEAAEDAA